MPEITMLGLKLKISVPQNAEIKYNLTGLFYRGSELVRLPELVFEDEKLKLIVGRAITKIDERKASINIVLAERDAFKTIYREAWEKMYYFTLAHEEAHACIASGNFAKLIDFIGFKPRFPWAENFDKKMQEYLKGNGEEVFLSEKLEERVCNWAGSFAVQKILIQH